MNRWCQPHRARRHAVQRSFERLERVDLLAIRRWFTAQGFDGLLVEALGPPRGRLLVACGQPAPPYAEWLERWAAAIVALERSHRRPASILDWFLDQTFLQVAAEVRLAAGAPTVRTIERALAERGAEHDALAVDAIFSATIVAAIDAAGDYDPERPLEKWLSGIALNVVRSAVRVERATLSLPRVDIDPDHVGRGVAQRMDHDDEREWLTQRALRGQVQVQRASEAVVVAHVLDGDRPAAEVAAQLGVSLARLYKRATAARTRLREAALELRGPR